MAKEMCNMQREWYNNQSTRYVNKLDILSFVDKDKSHDDALISLQVASSNEERSREYRIVAHIKRAEVLAMLGRDIDAEKAFKEAKQLNHSCSLLYSKMAKFYSGLSADREYQKELHDNVIEVFNQNELIRKADLAVYQLYYFKENNECGEEIDKVKSESLIWKKEYFVEKGNFKELLAILKHSCPVKLLDLSEVFHNMNDGNVFIHEDIEDIKKCIKNGLSNNYLYEDVGTIVKRGDVLFGYQIYTEALQEYNRSTELTECMLSDFKPYIELSELPSDTKIKLAMPFGKVAYLHSNKDYQSAIRYYSRAIEINPDCSEYHCGLGRAYYKIGSLVDAETSLNEAVRLDETSKEAHYNLGRASYEQGKYSNAFKYLSLAKEHGMVTEDMENMLQESCLQVKRWCDEVPDLKADKELKSPIYDFDKSIMGLDQLRKNAHSQRYILGNHEVFDDYNPNEQISQSLPINVGRGRDIKLTPISSPERNSAPSVLLAGGRGAGSWSSSFTSLSGNLSNNISWALGYEKK
jgi:tetratricopeptide (TPR) repeat protein